MSVEEVIDRIVCICGNERVKEAYLFGSRAKGTNLWCSDIDIAVAGVDDFERLSEAVSEIPTLFTIDVVNMDTCGNELLLEDIKIYGQKIYEKI